MESCFYPKSRKTRKRKKDDFWSDYLRRNCEDKLKIFSRREPKHLSNCLNSGDYHQTIRWKDSTHKIEIVRNRREPTNLFFYNTNSGRDINVIPVSDSERSQYQSNVFNEIFGKKFEGKTIRSLRGLSSQSKTETYHFCLK